MGRGLELAVLRRRQRHLQRRRTLPHVGGVRIEGRRDMGHRQEERGLELEWLDVDPAHDRRGLAIMVQSTPDPVCGDHLPMVLGTEGSSSIYAFEHSVASCVLSEGSFADTRGAGPDVTTQFAVGADGKIYQWDPVVSYWSFYGETPAPRLGKENQDRRARQRALCDVFDRSR